MLNSSDKLISQTWFYISCMYYYYTYLYVLNGCFTLYFGWMNPLDEEFTGCPQRNPVKCFSCWFSLRNLGEILGASFFNFVLECRFTILEISALLCTLFFCKVFSFPVFCKKNSLRCQDVVDWMLKSH